MELRLGVDLNRLDAASAHASHQRDFDAFFSETYSRVYRATLLVTGSREAAEDSVANAFLKAWERWDAVSAHPAPLAWVTRVAVNDSISIWRRMRNQSVAHPTWSTADDPGFPDPDVLAAVNSLSLRQRQVVALRILVGLDVAETAAALGIAPGTVTAHLHRALSECRQRLESNERTPRP